MADHTPTPWFADRKFVVGPRPSTDDQSDGMLCGVADVYGDNAKEDAAFIVRAANNHDALAAALRDLLDHFKPFTMKPVGAPDSPARLDQEMQIKVHAAGRAALQASEAAR